MKNLEFSPLTVRHLYNVSPSIWKDIFRLRMMELNYDKKYKFYHGDGYVFLGQCDEHNFSSSTVFNHPSKINFHLAELLKGRSLSLLADIAGAEDCVITKIEGNVVTFEHRRAFYTTQDLPMHSDESHSALLTRVKAELYASRHFSWMSANVLKRGNDTMGKFKVLRHHIHQNVFTGDMLQDPLLDHVTIGKNGRVSSARFNNGVEIKEEKISIDGKMPETVRAALIGQDAKAVLDHWLVKGGQIKNATQFSTKVNIVFGGESNKTFNKIIPDQIASYIKTLREREEAVRPPNLANYIDGLSLTKKDKKKQDKNTRNNQ